MLSSWLTPSATRGATTETPAPTTTVSATPLRTPFAASSSSSSAKAAEAEEAAELRRKVGRLKKLLGAANNHIEKLKEELSNSKQGDQELR